jgi:hypothetical protein
MAGISNQSQELSPKQTRALVAMLTAKDVASAAKQAGVGERTLHTWLDNPAFRAALKEAEASAVDKAVSLLAGASQYAVGVMLSIMMDESTPGRVRLRAAQSVLDQMVKLRQFDLRLNSCFRASDEVSRA